MSKIIDFMKKDKIFFVSSIAFIIALFIVFLNRGTYSIEEDNTTNGLVIDCPDSANVGETVECSININVSDINVYGINAKYELTEGLVVGEFTSDNWEVYLNDETGNVLVNLDGITGNATVGKVNFTLPTDAVSNSKYKIQLTDIFVGDGEDTVLNLENVFDEIRIKSNINTLDSMTLTNITLNETFDKDKTEYTGITDSDSVNIEVVKTDENSVVTGDIGDKDIDHGTNNFSIVVTSETGMIKTYTLDVYKEYKFDSNKYVYNEENNYLYIGAEKDSDTILNNIDIPDGLSKKIENDKLVISYKDEILSEINLIRVISNEYDLSKEYVYLGTGNIDLSMINVVNGTVVEENNKLVVKYGTDELDSKKLVKITSSEYDLSKEYIYLGTGNIDLSKISVVNGTVVEENNKLVVKYGADELDSRKLVKVTSSEYDLSKKYIYIGIDNIDLNKLNIVNGTIIEENNKIVVKYGTDELESWKFVRVTSSIYDLSKDYIYIGLDEFDIDNIDVVNSNKEFNNNKLIIRYGDYLFDEINILALSLGNLSVDNKVITLEDEIAYDDFVDNIKLNNDLLTYELLKANDKVTDGSITDGMVLKIYYNGNVIDSYDIMIYKISFNDNILVDDINEFMRFNAKTQRTTVEEFLENVSLDGSGQVFVTDSNNNNKLNSDRIATGDIFYVYVGSKKVLEYKIAVRGDTNGDGRISLLDLVPLRKSIAGTIDETTGEIYELTGIYYYAANINDDSRISLMDLGKIRKLIVGSNID